MKASNVTLSIISLALHVCLYHGALLEYIPRLVVCTILHCHLSLIQKLCGDPAESDPNASVRRIIDRTGEHYTPIQNIFPIVFIRPIVPFFLNSVYSQYKLLKKIKIPTDRSAQ